MKALFENSSLGSFEVELTCGWGTLEVQLR